MTGGENRAFRLSPALRAGVRLTLGAWMLLAAFPLFWILVMSFKLPVDAFAPNPMSVVFGPATRKSAGGISALDIAALIGAAVWLWKIAPRIRAKSRAALLLFFPAAAVFIAAMLLAADAAKGALAGAPVLGLLAEPLVGLTFQHYRAVWVEDAFYREFFNSAIITVGVVCLSLSIGAPAGYALARSRSQLAFWILVAALVFRALPHSVLITGYLQPFIDYGLYGKRIAVVIVLAAINQPFTIWMLSSFFASIPAELDESALVDGCTRMQAFRRVVMPVAWPGIITTGLFSFLLAYNDYLVTALLLDGGSMTMVPSITRYFNRETTMTDQVEAVAAAVSITAPLFVLVMVFQRQIVSGLTQGAVKG